MYTSGGEIEKDVEKNRIRKANGQNSRQTWFFWCWQFHGNYAGYSCTGNADFDNPKEVEDVSDDNVQKIIWLSLGRLSQ